MTIKNGAIFGLKDGSKPDGYEWLRYCNNRMAFLVQVGRHDPTIEQLQIVGVLPRVNVAYDELTHRLIEGSWCDDGTCITRKTVALTPEEIAANVIAAFTAKVKSMTNAVQAHLDTTAQSWGYDNIISLCTYDGNSDPKYSAEGAAGKEWRSSVWRYCEDELAKISEGTRVEPESNEAFIAELPTITRPKL